MNIKISIHILPWEIDSFHLWCIQLKKSKYYLPADVNIVVEPVLNLSTYYIEWPLSKIPKHFFIEKYNYICKLLVDYKLNKKIYQGSELYGHLDVQRESVSPEIDYYIFSCPDVYFDKQLLAYYCASIKHIKNKYFVLTPQIPKMWDSSWDIITNPFYQHTSYSDWQKIDIFDIIEDQSQLSESPIELKPLPTSKFAEWFDLYSKAFYEELVPVAPTWNGYGGWDYYSMIVADEFKRQGGDYQQYLLSGQTIVEYTTGPATNGMSDYYKKQLVIKGDLYEQGQMFKDKVLEYAYQRIQEFGNLK